MDDLAVLHASFTGYESAEASQDLAARLEACSDETLRDIAARAAEILKRREAQSRERAIAQIHRIAQEAGVKVSVSQPRKRGRPRKSERGLSRRDSADPMKSEATP